MVNAALHPSSSLLLLFTKVRLEYCSVLVETKPSVTYYLHLGFYILTSLDYSAQFIDPYWTRGKVSLLLWQSFQASVIRY
ncbi:hypothetical protein BCR41DRAFT_110945 [Lobosporangium transversale]|uniref:Uncharacterized protein n=1 Tax=Lobosporangium transversale TaxID=64571 RepID=A0A1Y2GJ62_9FUNG|nr:hypothetical protein BCR41DRAFT_110945 [Lobosporangium transversale]ORZ11305.1 hypothetical protein BCR41DRAFT_110945 [Lobosporangium transversale]|eukprot:XP_021879620.1 hypothetical protein BCR41DRAFT_110945 [Lobosporangium transversale]